MGAFPHDMNEDEQDSAFKLTNWSEWVESSKFAVEVEF